MMLRSGTDPVSTSIPAQGYPAAPRQKQTMDIPSETPAGKRPRKAYLAARRALLLLFDSYNRPIEYLVSVNHPQRVAFKIATRHLLTRALAQPGYDADLE